MARAGAALALAALACASLAAARAPAAPPPAPPLPFLPPDVSLDPLPTPVATAVAAAEAADAARRAEAADRPPGGLPQPTTPSNWTAAGGRLNTTLPSLFSLAAGGRDGAPLLAVIPPGSGGRVRLLRLDGGAWADAASPLDPPPGGELASLMAGADGAVYAAFGGDPPRDAGWSAPSLPAVYRTSAGGPKAAWALVGRVKTPQAPAPAPSAKKDRRAAATAPAGDDAAFDDGPPPPRDAALAVDGADVYLATAFADRGSGVTVSRLDTGAGASGGPPLEWVDLDAPAPSATAAKVRAAAGGGVLAVVYTDASTSKVYVKWKEVTNSSAVRGGAAAMAGTPAPKKNAKKGADNDAKQRADAAASRDKDKPWRDACGGSLPDPAGQLVNPMAVTRDGTIYVATNPYVEQDPLRNKKLPHNVWACAPRGSGGDRTWRPQFAESKGVPSPSPDASVLISSLAAAPDGALVMAYDGGPGGPYVLRLADGAWTAWGGLFGGGRARPDYDDFFQAPAVTLTPDGVPVVAASSALVDDSGAAEVIVKRCEACAAGTPRGAAVAAAPAPPDAVAPGPAPAPKRT